MIKKKVIQRTVAKWFRGYDKRFVNELARLLILEGEGFKIDTTKRLALFLAHAKAEVDVKRNGTVRMRENLNYSAARLRVPFKYFRHHPKMAEKYGKTSKHPANKVMIANIVYANRNGNGDIASGDGWRYRGWGLFQTTGKSNFERVIRAIEEVTGMKLHTMLHSHDDRWLDNYTLGILAGMGDWYASKIYNAKSVHQSTEIINYYTNTYAKRANYYRKLLQIIDGASHRV